MVNRLTPQEYFNQRPMEASPVYVPPQTSYPNTALNPYGDNTKFLAVIALGLVIVFCITAIALKRKD